MPTPYLGEIKLVSFNFPPKGWALCNGQLLPINQNQALFALLGTYYGGDGRVTFALPNLQGRIPLHFAPQYPIGTFGGEEQHTLIVNEIPTHSHLFSGSANPPQQPSPVNGFWPTGGGLTPYATAANNFLSPAAIGLAGGNQPHENRPPFAVLNFVIAIVGIFPSRN